MTERRTVRFNFMVSEVEHERLQVLAVDHGVSCADWLRTIIRKEFNRQHVEKPPHNHKMRNHQKKPSSPKP